MGWITKRNQERGYAMGSDAKVGKRAYPLRKIVGIKWVKGEKAWSYEHQYELLECGHLGELVESVGKNFFGAQVADSRRCRECYKIKNTNL